MVSNVFLRKGNVINAQDLDCQSQPWATVKSPSEVTRRADCLLMMGLVRKKHCCSHELVITTHTLKPTQSGGRGECALTSDTKIIQVK